MYMYIYIYTYIHTYIHTYTYIYIYIYIQGFLKMVDPQVTMVASSFHIEVIFSGPTSGSPRGDQVPQPDSSTMGQHWLHQKWL